MRRTHFERIGFVVMKLRYIRIHESRYPVCVKRTPRIIFLRNRMRRYAMKNVRFLHAMDSPKFWIW